jgi:hypothetical protein
MQHTGYIDVKDHPLTKLLENNWREILQEFNDNLLPIMKDKPNNVMGSVKNQKDSNGKLLYEGNIKSIFTRIAEESCSPNELRAVFGSTEETKLAGNTRLQDKRNKTPLLESILNNFEPYLGTVGFNFMSPSTILSKHYGMVSKYIRFHLGLIIDPDAYFLIEGYQPRSWQEGKVWAFDDGEAFHGTVHKGSGNRLILLIDIDKASFNNIKSETF